VQIQQIPANELSQQKSQTAKNPKKQQEGVAQEQFELNAQMFEQGKSGLQRGGVNCKSRD